MHSGIEAGSIEAKIFMDHHGTYVNLFLLPLLLVSVIGSLFVDAYMEAAQAAFYREVSGTELQAETICVRNEQ